ncbi:fimbrial protein [Undibacterium sp. CY7W]|uniref:Fimbrial protein n=1 Tax=Undibacterium rugosum TaxID=2762291 RepID=A0A923I6X2_9BURK|nr:fimbrial protein [Undibacterium rugosum]MBC3936731.1 fimbrial protein [Undibacterium rugosum]
MNSWLYQVFPSDGNAQNRTWRSLQHTDAKMLRICRQLFFLLLLSGISLVTHASTNCSIVSAPSSFTMPAVVTVPRDAPVGTLIGTPVSQNYSFTCTTNDNFNPGNPRQAYIQFRTANPASSTARSGGGIIIPTNLAGIGLLVNDTLGINVPMGDDFAFVKSSGAVATNAVTFQFIKTGAVTPGVVSAKANLFHFQWVVLGLNNSTNFSPDVYVSLNGGTNVNVIACSVSAGSANMTVSMPTIPTSALTGQGSATGGTPFSLNLTCQSGSTVKITMNTANASGTYPGVVQPTVGAGFAAGVGVQIRDGGGTPVSFGSKTVVGLSPDGVLSIPYSARYFQTGTTITAGNVAATVTFTMNYE